MKFKSLPQWERIFLPVWAGQLVSIAGSGLSEFALSLWVFQHTQSVTQFAFVLMFRIIPVILLSPLAGVLADRWDRRRVMILSDAGSALSTLTIALLFLSNDLQPWHVYVATAFSAAFGAFQSPAYLAAIPSFVPRESLGRVNGRLQIGQAITEILVPAIAGGLMVTIGISGIILIDLSTFLIAVATLLIVRFPRVEVQPDAHGKTASARESMIEGLHYILHRPDLQGLLTYNVAFSFFAGMLSVLLVPLIMGVTTVSGMGLVLTIAGSGLLAGSLVLSVWGGPSDHLKGMLAAGSLFGTALIVIGAGPSVVWVAVGAFIAHFSIPFANGFNQALWQICVEGSIQGRVFALRQMALRLVQPVAILIAGGLADTIFEPLLLPGGKLASNLGTWMGTGAGRGSALLVALAGLCVLGVSLLARLSTRLRQLQQAPDQHSEVAHIHM